MLKSRLITSFYFTLALAYSGLLFYIASQLPLWTKKWAAALTWVVYVQVIKSLIIYLSMVMLFVLFIKWFAMHHRWRFLGLCAVYLGILSFFITHLGDSVNEYIHFPEYAVCVLLWYAAFKPLEHTGPRVKVSSSSWPMVCLLARSPLCRAISVGLLLGILEEVYQGYLPQRIYDFYDILLNFLGVWLGGMLIWIFMKKKDPGTVRAPIMEYD